MDKPIPENADTYACYKKSVDLIASSPDDFDYDRVLAIYQELETICKWPAYRDDPVFILVLKEARILMTHYSEK